MRLDLYLVQKKLASSRSHAQELIHAGQVYLVKGQEKLILKKPNHSVSEDQDQILVEAGPANRFVSRGALNLKAL